MMQEEPTSPEGGGPAESPTAQAPVADKSKPKPRRKPRKKAEKRAKKGTKRRAHRPALYEDRRIQKQILDAMMVGLTKEQAAHAAGIDKRTLHRWLQEGEVAPPKSVLGVFTRKVEHMRDGAFRQRHLKNISDIALNKKKPNWVASAWLAERNFPEDYSLTHRLKVEGGMSVTLDDLDQLKKNAELNENPPTDSDGEPSPPSQVETAADDAAATEVQP